MAKVWALIGQAVALALFLASGRTAAQNASLPIQNAVLEGIQLSSQAGSEPGEKVVTGYFIFRDKPSSYFYELKAKDKTLVFEFHDAEKGSSPIPSTSEDPILGFSVDQRKVDVNKEVTGLNPEWHDVITVSFKLRSSPIVTVNDEYNVISFSYKWSTDPAKLDKYVVKEKKNAVWIWAGVGAGVLGAGAVVAAVIMNQDTTSGPRPLSISDLPSHKPY